MSYSKNDWEEKVGIIKKGGYRRLPLSGCVIDAGSKIDSIKFESDPHKKINIFGSFIIEQNGSQILSDDLTEDVEDFFNQLIVEKCIDEIKIDKKMNLIISILTEPNLLIKVDVTKNEYPYEKWEYCYKDGYITN